MRAHTVTEPEKQLIISLYERQGSIEKTYRAAHLAGLNVAPEKIRNALVESGINFVKGRKGIKKEQEEKVVQLGNEGNGVTKIKSEIESLTIHTIRKILEAHGIKVKKGIEKIPKEIINSIMELAEGCKSGLELFRRTWDKYKISEYYVEKIIEEKGIRFERGIPERDALILQGYDLGTIARQIGITKEAVRTYILRTGQYEVWKAERQKIIRQKKDEKELPKARKEIEKLIDSHILKKAEEEQGWAYAKATEYFLRSRHSDLPFEKVLALFKAYENAIQNKETLSLTELSEKAGFDKWYTSNLVLNTAGLPLFNPPKAYSLSEEQRQALINAKSLDYISAQDASHFTGCSKAWASIIFRNRETQDTTFEKIRTYTRRAGYAKCSRIYEAADAGFTIDEICEYADATKTAARTALLKRPVFEPALIHAMKTMYPNREITKPYL